MLHKQFKKSTWPRRPQVGGLLDAGRACVFSGGVLEEAAKKLGRSNPDIALMNSDRELRRNILYSIVCNLRREKDAIARGLIKDGYFGGPFIVRMQDGKELSTYYTPFNAEVFGETVSYFEGLKTGKIQEIEEVRPKIQK